MLEFAQPAALWMGLSIGLPILAHMAYRRVTQKYAFPSLRFIRPSNIPRTGRKPPSDILLLTPIGMKTLRLEFNPIRMKRSLRLI